MPGAVIVASQPGGAGAGSPGVARNDLWVGKAINFSVGSTGNNDYQWYLLSKPAGSTATLDTPTLATTTLLPDAFGTYRVQLLTNGGGTGNSQIRVFRVRYTEDGELGHRGWAIPALLEAFNESNYDGNTRGWSEPLEYMIEDIRVTLDELEAGGGGGTGPELEALQEQVDNLSAVVDDLGADFGGLDSTLAATVTALATLNTELMTRVVELPLAAGQFSDSLGSWTRAGARSVDLSKYPAMLGSKMRIVRFCAVFENSGSNVNFSTEARLFNYTHAEVVVSSALTNVAAGDRTAPADRSTVLVEGTTAGTLRTNAAALYEVQFRANGALTPPNDRAVLSSARLEISYVTP